jgi:hypothetical protein
VRGTAKFLRTHAAEAPLHFCVRKLPALDSLCEAPLPSCARTLPALLRTHAACPGLSVCASSPDARLPCGHAQYSLYPHTGLLEREHFPFPAHPRRHEINSALAGYRTLALAHSPAAPAPPLPPAEGVVAAGGPAMTLQDITDALSSSLAGELAPALRELAHVADNGDVEDLKLYISHVSSKRILGHADFTVRAAAVAALAALVKRDENTSIAGVLSPLTGRCPQPSIPPPFSPQSPRRS